MEWFRRQSDLSSVHPVVVATVLKLFPNTFTDLNIKVGSNCDVTTIEQRMKIPSKQQSVFDPVSSALGKWFDVSSIQRREGSLVRHSTTSFVCISNKYPERPLTKPWKGQRRRPVTRFLLAHLQLGPSRRLKLHPKRQPRFHRQIIAAALDNVAVPIGRNRHPVGFGQKKWLVKENASDVVVSESNVPLTPVSFNAGTHLREISRTVCNPERFPGQAYWQ